MKSVHAASGEYLTLGELLKRGFNSYLAHGPTQRGWDIIIIKNESDVQKIQVKTINWPDQTAVNICNNQFDYLIIVLLNKPSECKPNNRSQYLIIPENKIENLLSNIKENRKDNGRTINIKATFLNDEDHVLKKYLNKWEI